jgi:hypothetical protein
MSQLWDIVVLDLAPAACASASINDEKGVSLPVNKTVQHLLVGPDW